MTASPQTTFWQNQVSTRIPGQGLDPFNLSEFQEYIFDMNLFQRAVGLSLGWQASQSHLPTTSREKQTTRPTNSTVNQTTIKAIKLCQNLPQPIKPEPTSQDLRMHRNLWQVYLLQAKKEAQGSQCTTRRRQQHNQDIQVINQLPGCGKKLRWEPATTSFVDCFED